MHYIPNHSVEKEMLDRMGLSSIDDLFEDVPPAVRIDGLNIPPAASELEVLREMEELMSDTRGGDEIISFLGGGFYDHFIPTVVDNVLSRSELYTSYTPYQPEMSQGILQSLFEYQSLMSDLTGMAAVNTSMYDHPTALGEAVLMAHRINHKKVFLVPELLARDKAAVLENYIIGSDITIQEVPFLPDRGTMDPEALSRLITPDVSGLYIENPNILGLYDPLAVKVKEMLQPRQVLVVGVNPMSLGIAKPPGDYGADIVIGDAQPLGIHMSYGGPTTGIFGTSMKIMRKMPGRIIGATLDADGRRAYCMTLSTREQHIRRERATSNICTNEALTSIAVAAYLAALGKSGFRDLSMQLASRSRHLAEMIDSIEGFRAPAFEGSCFNEFPVKTDVDPGKLMEEAEGRGVLAGIDVSGIGSILDGVFTVSTTEMHTEGDYLKLIDVLKRAREVVR